MGDFLAAATRQLNPVLPTPGRKQRRQPLNFAPPQRGRSPTAAKPKAAAPPTVERRAQVQLLRTLGIVGVDEPITPEAMKAYDDLFAAPIPKTVLAAITALVGRELPA